ncbi:MAG: hypothetical protein SFU98_18565 [Leptospiraceae bacterium]|nr:hypothetical protein [Leptospiraceae bacterium]
MKKFIILSFLLSILTCKKQINIEETWTKPRLSSNEQLANYVERISNENKINFDDVNNQTAYIPSMCYTKTENKHNPCYTCHNIGKEPNYNRDVTALFVYNFPESSNENPWKNLFITKTKNYSSEEMKNYIQTDNYLDVNGEITLQKNLPKDWKGYVPDCYFNFDKEGFDKDKEANLTGWRAYRYYPFPGTFFPTNGSIGDVMIRLPKYFAQDEDGNFNLEVYKANLSILETSIKQRNINSESIDEKKIDYDLNFDGIKTQTEKVSFIFPDKKFTYVGLAKKLLEEKKIYLSGGLFPIGTEFLHSVRYIESDNDISLAKRFKELRYMRKHNYYNYAELYSFMMEEAKETKFKDRNLPENFEGDFQTGLYTGRGWTMQGFIEDKKGNLRPQTKEETLFCVGCHSGLGATKDGVFSFDRKIEDKNDSWKHWKDKGLKNQSEKKIVSNNNTIGEYAFYLEMNHAGDEFRANSEIINNFFDSNNKLKPDNKEKLSNDISSLLYPSANRANELNKAYRRIVEEQTYSLGRDSVIKSPTTVFKQVPKGQTTGLTLPEIH